MTFDELEQELPNGLHDALLLKLDVDWVRRSATLQLSICVSVPDETRVEESYRPVSLTFSDLEFLTIEPPVARYENPEGRAGLRVDAGSGDPPNATAVPAVNVGAFKLWVFVAEWNAFIRVGARDALLTWNGADDAHSGNP